MLIPMSVADSDLSDASTIVVNGDCGDGLSYTLDADGVLTVSGTGPMYDYNDVPMLVASDGGSYADAVKTVVVGEGVTTIGDQAFPYCGSLVSVSVPSTLVSVGHGSFEGCTSLAGISLPSVTSVGYDAFLGCVSLRYADIPSAVHLDDQAFCCCTSLVSVEPFSVTRMGDLVFSGCTSLASASLPCVTSMGGEVFLDCTSLVSVSLPSMDHVPSSTFSGCTSLVSANMPSARELYDRSFSGCTSLISVDLSSVTHVYEGAFSGCTSLSSAYMPLVEILEDEAFSGCTSLTSVFLSSVGHIGHYVFEGCISMAYFDMTKVGADLEAEEGVLQELVFYGPDRDPVGCADMAGHLYMGADGVLYEVRNHVHVFFERSVIKEPACTSEGVYVIRCAGCDTVLDTFTVPMTGHRLVHEDGKAPTSVEPGWEPYDHCADCPYTTYREIPPTGLGRTVTVTYVIGDTVLPVTVPCGSVLSPSEPSKEGYVFMGWEGHTEGMVVEEDVTLSAIFQPLPSKTYTVTIMYNDGAVERLEVPEGSTIDEPRHVYAYYSDAGHTRTWAVTSKVVRDLTVYAVVLMTGPAGLGCEWTLDFSTGDLVIEGVGATFSYTTVTKFLWYPYKAYVSSVHIGEGITEIGERSFYRFSSLNEVYLPDSLKTVGKYAFYGDTSLTHIAFGSGLTAVRYQAFENVGFSLSDGTAVPVTVGSLVGRTFSGYGGKLVLTHAEGRMGDILWDFDGVSGRLTVRGHGSMDNMPDVGKYPWYPYRFVVKAIEVGDGVTSVGAYAFKGYRALESVVLSDTVLRVEKYSFSGDTGLSYVEIGKGLAVYGYMAFENTVFLLPDGRTEVKPSADTLNGRVFEGASGRPSLVYADTSGDGVTWTFDASDGVLTLTGGGRMAEHTSPGQYSWGLYRPYVRSLVVGDGVTQVSAYAFKDCIRLSSVTFSDSVETVQKYAFDGDSSLTHVEFGTGLKTFSGVAFSVTFHKTVSSSKTVSVNDLKGHVFEGRTKLVRAA
ncbi:MAG: leucine-rich repeat protein [archaeon]|nr:leucine-rich repeat protein [archaeon]